MIRKSVLGKGVLGQSGGGQTVAAGNVDSGLATVNLSVSSTDVYADISTHDSATAAVSLTPSDTEQYTSLDSDTGQVILTAKLNIFEIHTTFDSNTATIKLSSETYEIKKGGIVHHVIPPRDSIQYAAYLLRNIEREIERIKRNKRPTMPIYDRTNFPSDSVTGQHAIATDGSLWIYNGGWVLIAGA